MNQVISLDNFFWQVDKTRRTRLTILLLYDQRDLARRALTAIQNLTEYLHQDLELDFEPWRFDVLWLPEARAAITRTIKEARLVVVASTPNLPLPAAVEAWLGGAEDPDLPSPTAPVIFLDCQSGERGSGTIAFLQFLEGVASSGSAASAIPPAWSFALSGTAG